MTIAGQKLYLERSVVSDGFGETRDLPVVPRYHRVVASIGGHGASVLEVGAGDRSFGYLSEATTRRSLSSLDQLLGA